MQSLCRTREAWKGSGCSTGSCGKGQRLLCQGACERKLYLKVDAGSGVAETVK